MRINKRGDTMISVIIAVVLFTIVRTGIMSISNTYTEEIMEIKKQEYSLILDKNTNNILDKVLSGANVASGSYYIYKDNTNNTFSLVSGSIATNKSFMFIDQYGNKINNVDTFEGNIFSRVILLNNKGNNEYIYGINIDSIQTDQNRASISTSCFFDSAPGFDTCKFQM